MVVVLIIAILLAVAIPTFLGARSKAQDRSAQSSLRNALTAAKTLSSDTGTFTAATNTALGTAEPSLTYSASGVASASEKSVSVFNSATNWAGAALSASGTCFFIRETTSAGARFGSTSTAAHCTGASANAGAASANW